MDITKYKTDNAINSRILNDVNPADLDKLLTGSKIVGAEIIGTNSLVNGVMLYLENDDGCVTTLDVNSDEEYHPLEIQTGRYPG